MDLPQWKKPYTGYLVLAAILLVPTAALVADTVKLTIGTNPVGMLTGYVAGAVLSALVLIWSLMRACQIWRSANRKSRRRRLLCQQAALLLIALYLLFAVASGWMMFFGHATGVPIDVLHGTILLVLATDLMVPVIIISSLRKE